MAIPIFKMATIGLLPSPLKILYYRLRGAKFGKNVRIGLLSVLNADIIEIGDYSKIGFCSFINCKEITLGKRVKVNSMVAIDTGKLSIDNDSTIMEQVVIGGMITSRSLLTIGKNVKIFPYSFINPTEPIEICDEVGIGGSNYLFTHGSWQSELDGFPISFGPIKIEKGVWLPWRVFVLPNVKIGEFATIGANSVITKNIAPYCLALGSPAKVVAKKDEYIKSYSIEDKKKKLISYFNSMVDYFNYIGIKTDNIIEKKDSFSFEMKVGNKFRQVYYSYEFEKRDNVDIQISYTPIRSNIKKNIITENKLYFSIQEKETIFSKKKEWTLIRDLLSRYGIRFVVKDK
jgi:acetyltransferase-like isoleucine patch superfamily enzyme